MTSKQRNTARKYRRKENRRKELRRIAREELAKAVEMRKRKKS